MEECLFSVQRYTQILIVLYQIVWRWRHFEVIQYRWLGVFIISWKKFHFLVTLSGARCVDLDCWVIALNFGTHMRIVGFCVLGEGVCEIESGLSVSLRLLWKVTRDSSDRRIQYGFYRLCALSLKCVCFQNTAYFSRVNVRRIDGCQQRFWKKNSIVTNILIDSAFASYLKTMLSCNSSKMNFIRILENVRLLV